MKKIILALVVCMISSLASAQFGFGKLEDILEVQQKPLLVVLDAKEEKTLKKLAKKPEELAAYEKSIDDYNNALKAAFASAWTFSKNVEFVTEEEFAAIEDDKVKKKQYAYFKNKVRRYWRKSSNGVNRSNHVPDTFLHQLGLTDQGKPVWEFMFDTTHPNEADLTFILQQFQQYMTARLQVKGGEKTKKELKEELEKKAALLKEKTLLLDEEYVDKKVLNQIGELYKYKYKITTKAEIDQAILSRAKDVAYLKSVPAVQSVSKSPGVNNSEVRTATTIYVQYIINAENGETLTGVNPDIIGPGNNMTLTISDLKKIIKNIENN